MAALAAVFVLALAATIATHLAIYQQSDFFQEWLAVILLVDVVLIGLLIAIVVWSLAHLLVSWRRGVQGARLSLRITLLLWGASLLPAVLLYSVSVSAVFRGIESWFDIPLGKSFGRGIAFGQDVIGREFERLEYVGRDIARSMPARRGRVDFYISNAQLLYGLSGIAIYDQYGELLSVAGDIDDNAISPALIGRVLSEGLYLNLKGGGIDRTTELALPFSQRRAVLLVARPLPEDIASGLLEIENGRQEYEKLGLLRRGLRWSFILTMSLALALILFAAGWFSLSLGRRLARPLVQLSAAAEAVGQGNFDHRLNTDRAYSLSEIAHLNESFNSMVLDLKKLHQETAERQEAVQKSKAYLENLLSSLTTGVLTFSADGGLSGYNKQADRFFDGQLQRCQGRPVLPPSELSRASEEAAKTVRDFDEDSAERRAVLPSGRVLLVRARALSKDAGSGLLVMIDDISRQIRAEREATWEEASRRFVHEIKNPLTPIQLAAERLGGKLKGKLSDSDEQMLQRLVEMIVSQVGAMRHMVESFREYADVKGAAAIQEIQLNDLLSRVIYFYDASHVTINLSLQKDLPLVSGSPVTLRQLLHNVLGNAMDVLAGRSGGRIDISTRAAGNRVQLTIEDNGGGVPEAMLEKICEPYVTNKPDGTGLGLAVVRKTVEEHGGKLRIENGASGLAVTIQLHKKN